MAYICYNNMIPTKKNADSKLTKIGCIIIIWSPFHLFLDKTHKPSSHLVFPQLSSTKK